MLSSLGSVREPSIRLEAHDIAAVAALDSSVAFAK